MRLYPNGFLISDQQFHSLPDYYNRLKFMDKFYYYYDSNRLPFYEERDGYFIIIHGHFVHVGPETNMDQTTLLTTLLETYQDDYEDFLTHLDFIGGRYVIIIGDSENIELYPDATAARTAYYSTNYLIASSHVHLINDLIPHEKYEIGERAPLLTYHWDTTPYENIKSLNPNHKTNIINKKRERFFPRKENEYSKLDHTTKLQLMNKLWKDQIYKYQKAYENIIFSITGGADSRVSLSMAKDYKNYMRFFTYSTAEGETKKESKYANILSDDQYIVRQILKDVPINHEFFFFDQREGNLTKKESRILNKNTIKQHGRFIIPFYKKSFPEKNVMHLRGTPLEIGRAYFLLRRRKNISDEIRRTFNHNMKKYSDAVSNDEINIVFNDACEDFGYNKDLFNYHKLDLYYWENRMGRWHSEILNENDVCFETFMPFNMRSMINISLSYTRKERRSGYMFNELINENYPILNFYGKNNKSNLYEQLRDIENNNTVFRSFIVYLENSSQEIFTEDNSLYLPRNYMKKKGYAELVFKFAKEKGFINLGVLNKYSNESAKEYLKYEILVNDKKILEEDIAAWNQENKISVFNLRKNDTVKLRLTSLKNIDAASWENASILNVTYYEEIAHQKVAKKDISATSPFSIMNLGD